MTLKSLLNRTFLSHEKMLIHPSFTSDLQVIYMYSLMHVTQKLLIQKENKKSFQQFRHHPKPHHCVCLPEQSGGSCAITLVSVPSIGLYSVMNSSRKTLKVLTQTLTGDSLQSLCSWRMVFSRMCSNRA